MKLLLIFPSWCDSFGVLKQVAKKASSFPPLGLCYIASLAEKTGWEAKIIDAEVEGLSLADILSQINEFRPDLIGFTSTTPFFQSVETTASFIKKHFDIPIILGGPHASLTREKAFSSVFDYLFIGECEVTFPRFLESFAEKKRGKNIAGIMTREKGEIVFYGESPKIQNLDDIPWPARHLLKYKKYTIGTLKGKKVYTSLFMSRGCPYQCIFCASDLYGKQVRRRSLEDVIKEIDYIINELGINHIYFLDDTLTLNRNYIIELCSLIKKHKFKFTFEGSTRANLWDEELVKMLKEVGLIRISFGLETVDLEVRKIIKKEVPIQSYIDANRLNAKYKIETINSVMLGLPGESRESIKKTVDFLCKARDIEHATYSIAIPYPGTELYNMAKRKENGLELVSEDFATYQRYGSSVMKVGDLNPEDIVLLQKKGLIRIYTRWWRIWPILKRHGVRALIAPVLDAIKSVFKWGAYKIKKNIES